MALQLVLLTTASPKAAQGIAAEAEVVRSVSIRNLQLRLASQSG
jgi:hypothetical protein